MAGDAPTNPEKAELRVGSYRLLKPLGSGGMSSVFRAEHVENGLVVALKVLPRNLARNKTLLQRFLREAKSAEALEHPNIVAIYDRGLDQGRYYIVLEYVSGGDLHDWVRTRGPMPIAEAVAAIRSVAEGLQFAAERGLIHRDIKPANLLMTPEGRVKIADLGLALHADDEDERVTREGTTVGTVDYMSPEKARDSRGTSVRSDMYSLGCTFFFLLTGQPPFPGGDVADKLSRHCSAPPPDLMSLRPDIPDALNRLVQTMLAKRPEHRFADYVALTAALDAFTRGEPVPGPEGGQGEALYAILDEDGDDEAPDGFLPLTLPGPDDSGRHPEPAPASEGFLLAELADLDDGGEPTPAARRPAARPQAPAALAVAEDDPPPSGLLDDGTEVDEGGMPGHVALGPGRKMSDSERSWLTACIAGGLALIVFVIGADLLIRSTSSSSEPTVQAPGAGEPLPAVVAPEPAAPVAAVKPRPAPVKPEPKGPAARAGLEPVHAPSEPIDPAPEVVPEAEYAREVLARFRPDWAAADVPARLPGRLTTVRRVPDPADADQKPTLRAALDVVGGGTVEVADNGPFFESDLKVVGDARSLRARPGFRPVVCLQGSRLDGSKPPGLVTLDGRALTLDGLDVVVDARALAPEQASVFYSRGGSLTLRNCTVTVVNRGGRSVSLVQAVPSDRPSKIRLERTLVRGGFASVVDISGGGSDVLIDRSVVVNGEGAGVYVSGKEPGDRRVFVSRSVVATRGPAFETFDPPDGSPRPLAVRALGSTFAHVQSPGRIPFCAAHRADAAGELLSWDGVSNVFEGWSAWLTSGSPPGVRVPDLAAVRMIWPGDDGDSRETPRAWPLTAPFDAVGPEKIRLFALRRADVLTRVAQPSPWLFEKTLDAFPAPADPGIAPPAPAPRAPTPPAAGGEASGVPGVRDLVFRPATTGGDGDLGKFIASSVKAGDRLVRVRASGAGVFPFTPLRLPDGVSLDVAVEPDAKGQVPAWVAAGNSSGEALIEVRGGGVRLSGLALSRDASARLKALVNVERGHLAVHRCRFVSTAPGDGGGGGGGLVAFKAPGSLPLERPPWPDPTGAWPLERWSDRPTCRVTESVLVSSGDVFNAEAGRGLVAVGQSVIVAGATAFVLTPGRVARHRFDADLWLDHCTVAAESNFVALGPWGGAEPGPDRPWLVTTHRCAFFGAYTKPSRDPVLLRVDPESFAHGALLWQATGDAFEVPVFTAPVGANPPENRRPDVARQWTDLWGPNHFHSVSGPRPPHYSPSVRPVTRLKPGRVEVGDLFIDPTYPSESPPPRDLGADLTRLGISPTSRPVRRH